MTTLGNCRVQGLGYMIALGTCVLYAIRDTELDLRTEIRVKDMT